MHVLIDHRTRQLILIGANGHYEARLDWTQTMNLIGRLDQGAKEIEPGVPEGKTYRPTIGRWG